MATASPTLDQRVPVTVLTGFLGSGKTTLLYRILTENHGKRIAVIENEFGEVGVDQELVIGAEEEIFEMNNGCICCTVRGDLIRILGNLMKRREKFDYILVETTGMADPGPVAQTFFVDDEMQSRLKLDGIVTLVDAKHVWLHIEDSDEVKEQIAFADVILLNKTDLVEASDLDKLEKRIHSMNAAAKIYRTQNATIDMDSVLNVGGFNLDRAMEVDPLFMEPEYPFEWGGLFHLQAGRYELRLEPGPDPAMKAVLLPGPAGQVLTDLGPFLMEAVLGFSAPPVSVARGEAIPVSQPTELQLDGSGLSFSLAIAEEGDYALFTENHPDEFNARFMSGDAELKASFEKIFKPDHEHDEEVTSVGIDVVGDLDKRRFNQWLSTLLQTQGADIFRMKGVISLKGETDRFVFQGVHMLFDGRPDRPWGKNPRRNQLIFIGRNLNRVELNEAFKQCLV